MNLPDLYARVVAKRPELAVPFLEHCPDDDPNDKCPWIGENNDLLTESTAAALILARWVEALPEGNWLAHVQPSNTIPSGWRVWRSTKNGYNISPLRSIPLEALAAFYLGEQP